MYKYWGFDVLELWCVAPMGLRVFKGLVHRAYALGYICITPFGGLFPLSHRTT